MGYRWLVAGLWAIALATGLGACRGDVAEVPNSDAAADLGPDALDRRIILENATLNQADPDGNPLWDITAARIAYSADREQAELESLTGNLYEGGELALQIRAEQGTLLRDGEEILLRGDISAIDPRNEAVVRAREARWLPQERQLIAREDFSGNHPRLDIKAREGIYDAVAQSFTARGDIEAIARTASLLLKAEEVVWSVPEATVSSDRPLQIDRFADDTTTDRIVAKQATVDLEAERATLTGDVELRSVEPPVQIASDAVTWDFKARLVSTEVPVRIIHTTAEIDVTGNRGRFDLARETVTLSGGVEGRSATNQAELYAERLEWDIRSQQMRARGNVLYQQADPPFVSRGDSAEGNLRSRTIAVRSNASQGVVSEIEF